MLEFFKKCRAQNIPVISPMLQAKAAAIASRLQIEKFESYFGTHLCKLTTCLC
jgi:hypothetical protein